MRPFDDRLEQQRQPFDAGAEDSRATTPDRDRPQELGHTRACRPAGCSGRASEKVPKPVKLSSPMKISEPTPASEQAGARARLRASRRRSPATSIIKNAGRQRRAEERADRGEASGGADHDTGPLRRVALDQVDGEDTRARCRSRSEAPPGPRDDPEAEGSERGDDDPGKFDRLHGPGCLEPLRRLVPCRSRQVADREGYYQARSAQSSGNRPPDRLAFRSRDRPAWVPNT